MQFDWRLDDPHDDYVPVEKWPNLLVEARKMAKGYSTNAGCEPRFSVLRLWSNPYFCPLMMALFPLLRSDCHILIYF